MISGLVIIVAFNCITSTSTNLHSQHIQSLFTVHNAGTQDRIRRRLTSRRTGGTVTTPSPALITGTRCTCTDNAFQVLYQSMRQNIALYGSNVWCFDYKVQHNPYALLCNDEQLDYIVITAEAHYTECKDITCEDYSDIVVDKGCITSECTTSIQVDTGTASRGIKYKFAAPLTDEIDIYLCVEGINTMEPGLVAFNGVGDYPYKCDGYKVPAFCGITQELTNDPTESPTYLPSEIPIITIHPTPEPTLKPTKYPTLEPTPRPTIPIDPTQHVTPCPTTSKTPTFNPTRIPVAWAGRIYDDDESIPTELPTLDPTMIPTDFPTEIPSQYPTSNPTPWPTSYPTEIPSNYPSTEPTPHPTPNPTSYPTTRPTVYPTPNPTLNPTLYPTPRPTTNPVPNPTFDPTLNPTLKPTPYPIEWVVDNIVIDDIFHPTIQEPSPYPTPNPTPRPTRHKPGKHVDRMYPTAHQPTASPTFPTKGCPVCLSEGKGNKDKGYKAVPKPPIYGYSVYLNMHSKYDALYDSDMNFSSPLFFVLICIGIYNVMMCLWQVIRPHKTAINILAEIEISDDEDDEYMTTSDDMADADESDERFI